MAMPRDLGNPGYLLALEVTNLRLAVELAFSALRLGRIDDAVQHLADVAAPGRRVDAGGQNRGRRPPGSTGRAAGDWRSTRPSLLARIVLERRDRHRRDEEDRELLLDRMQLDDEARGEGPAYPPQ